MKTSRQYTLFLLILLCRCYLNAQTSTIAFRNLDSLLLKEERPVVIFIHTNWCRYCELMKQTSFTDDSVSFYLKQYYYTVFLDAEDHNSITFKNKTYYFKPNGINNGIHELAIYLSANDKIIYPSLYILNSKLNTIESFHGYQSPRQLRTILRKVLLKND